MHVVSTSLERNDLMLYCTVPVDAVLPQYRTSVPTRVTHPRYCERRSKETSFFSTQFELAPVQPHHRDPAFRFSFSLVSHPAAAAAGEGVVCAYPYACVCTFVDPSGLRLY
jgi:hypothetical protein